MQSISKPQKPFFISLILIPLVLMQSCEKSKPASPAVQEAFDIVIPKPVSSTASGKTFFLTKHTTIIADDGDEVQAIAGFLAAELKPATGFEPGVRSDGDPGRDAVILTMSGADKQLGDEGYELSVTEDQVRITANKPAGLFYGVQTLLQLLPPQIESETEQDVEWEIATGTIRDYPAYPWRGAMLDVARHFFPVENIKRYIDLISYYKMNRLHLHLSDDQGWRIEIKSWPNLTEIGGRTQVGGGTGGYYTQQQYKDIVAYARSRYITVVPEIDLPGHINAALVSYSELNVNPSLRREAGIPGPEVDPVPGQFYTGTDVGFSTLDITKPITFRFVEDVLRELATITPGPYLHIGGDEAAVTKKPDYIVFVNRFKEIVEANGKTMIGWEEISQGDIDSTVIVQHWASPKYASLAAKKGAKMIFSPAQKVYLDMQYDSTTRLGLHWAAYIEVDSSYSWDPATRIEGINRNQILGVEAPLWTETITTMDDIEYMAFPRIAGVAEIGWSVPELRKWDEYKIRLGKQSTRWTIMGIDYYASSVVPWTN